MKPIQFALGDQVFNANLGSRIEKKALYGFAKRVAEKEGKILTRGYLAQDGSVLRRSEIATLKMDPEGSPVEELQVEIEGQPAELKPAVFDGPNPVTPVPLKQLAGFNTTDVYPLESATLPSGLYETEFTYRKAYTTKEALVLVKANGEAFLLVGSRKLPTFVGQSVSYAFFDSDDAGDADDSEDLDFSMV